MNEFYDFDIKQKHRKKKKAKGFTYMCITCDFITVLQKNKKSHVCPNCGSPLIREAY